MSAFLRSLLAQRNYEVTIATAGVARTMLRDNRTSIDVLITNVPLEFTGTPDVPLLYLAANPLPEAIRGFERVLFLVKPFHPRDLLDCIRKLLA